MPPHMTRGTEHTFQRNQTSFQQITGVAVHANAPQPSVEDLERNIRARKSKRIPAELRNEIPKDILAQTKRALSISLEFNHFVDLANATHVQERLKQVQQLIMTKFDKLVVIWPSRRRLAENLGQLPPQPHSSDPSRRLEMFSWSPVK